MGHHDVLDAVSKGISVILTEHTNSERGYLSEVLQPRLQSLLRLDQGLDAENDVQIEETVSTIDRDPLEIM
jgi:putative NIF3 family GTP cyclohydrolase 1 type 2